jgi:hypothetical protein
MTEKPDYAGMTLNERLWTTGLIEKFDKAILLCDCAGAIAVLVNVDVADPESTVDAIFAHPGKYGYY